MANATEKREELRKLMKGIDIAMFTTLGENGFPVSRPLSTQQVEFDGKLLWFFVRRNSAKVKEMQRYPRVNVAYSSKDKNVYLSVAGSADIVDDQGKIDEFWNDALKAFFPRGRTDPNLVLVRVTVHSVEYWQGPSTAIGKAVAFVIARVTKNDDAMGETHLLRFKPSGEVTARKVTTERPAKPQGATRKAAGKKAATKKTATNKAATKKAGTKKAGTKKAAAGKSSARPPAAKKAPGRAPKRAR
jgi:general stress protein 26